MLYFDQLQQGSCSLSAVSGSSWLCLDDLLTGENQAKKKYPVAKPAANEINTHLNVSLVSTYESEPKTHVLYVIAANIKAYETVHWIKWRHEAKKCHFSKIFEHIESFAIREFDYGDLDQIEEFQGKFSKILETNFGLFPGGLLELQILLSVLSPS